MEWLAIASLSWAILSSIGLFKYYKAYKHGERKGYTDGWVDRDKSCRMELAAKAEELQRLQKEGTAIKANRPDVPFKFP